MTVVSVPSYEEKLEPVKPGIFYRLFNPQVPVIICCKFQSSIAAMPANSCSSVSDSPPMAALALKKGIRTGRILRLSKRFSINWVDFEPKSSRKRILDLADPTESSDKLRDNKIPYRIMRKVPVLQNVTAFAIAEVQRQIRTGDHDLFIARITLAKAIRDFTLDEYWRFENYKPVFYLGSIRSDPFTTLTPRFQRKTLKLNLSKGQKMAAGSTE